MTNHESELDGSPPGYQVGPLPEVQESAEKDWFEQNWNRWFNQRLDPVLRSFKHFKPRLAAIDKAEKEFNEMDLLARNCAVVDLRHALSRQKLDSTALIQAFALVRVAMEQVLGLRLYDEQLYAGWCLLEGNCIEMQTGEGKTLTAALPATLMGLAGVPVHVITSNEYLVRRDCAELEPLYRWFGLSAGVVLSEQNEEDRRAGYACNIAYCTHQQVVFDYLRDVRALKHNRRGLAARLRGLIEEDPELPIQRGLCFAIVDEADSVLIDDARTPLILAEQASTEEFAKGEAAVALAIARELDETTHYLLKNGTRRARLTEAGLQLVRQCTAQLSGSWQFERYRNERICQALAALHLFRRDIDYLVKNDKVELVDRATGRPTPQRRLQHGLHRILEVKEHCSMGVESNPVSALSFQRFFPRYHKLSGMSGTVWEVQDELHKIYGAKVLSIPTVRPARRVALPPLVACSRDVQMQKLVEQVKQLRAQGRAILIGTRTVQLSDRVSGLLNRHAIRHTVLNARQDTEEAQVIKQAGSVGNVTVATNMAGRGTDIKPDPAVLEAGGLHVINIEINDSPRVDRQLHGRSGRQGDPGSSQDIFCLDDEVLVKELNPMLFRLLTMLVMPAKLSSSRLAVVLIRHAQGQIEDRHRRERLAVARGQTQLQRALAIGGTSE